MSELHENIKKQRKSRRWTQAKLAKMIGKSHSAVSLLEAGTGKIDIDLLKKLCAAFEIDAETLLGWEIAHKTPKPPKPSKTVKPPEPPEPPKKPEIIRSVEAELVAGLFDRADDEDKMIVRVILKKYESISKKMKIYREIPLYLLPASAGTGAFLDGDDYELVTVSDDEVPPQATFGVRISGDSMEPKYRNGDIAWVQFKPLIDPGQTGVFVVNGEGFIKQLRRDKLGKVYLHSLNPDYGDIILGENDCCRNIGVVLATTEDI